MNVDFIVVGQGIAGTWLSYYLQKNNKTFLLFDEFNEHSSSRNAAGIINPITGRRLVSAWMVDQLHPYANEAYNDMGKMLGIHAISRRDIIDFFPNPFMKENFEKRLTENAQYLKNSTASDAYEDFFNFEFGCGIIQPAYTVHLDILLPAWRERLKSNHQLIEEPFQINLLEQKEDGIFYEGIHAQYIIFCEGTGGYQNPYFKQLPFAPNKGEALIIKIKGGNMPTANTFKKSVMLVPISQLGVYWVGASNTWSFEDESPTQLFKQETTKVLDQWLKMPYTIQAHLSSLRPATIERRPFVGMHPTYKRIGILNGMGTKGCSLAPFFAHQLCEHILHGASIDPFADVQRHSRLLLKDMLSP